MSVPVPLQGAFWSGAAAGLGEKDQGRSAGLTRLTLAAIYDMMVRRAGMPASSGGFIASVPAGCFTATPSGMVSK